MNTNHATQTMAANPPPMRGWTSADLLDSAKRLRREEGLSLADDWAEQLQVAAQLLNVHGELVIALGAILAVASNANATALCDDTAKTVCPASCAHPRPVAGVTFIGRSIGLPDFTLNGKTSRVLCFRYEGSTDTAIVTYDEIFHGAFEP